MKEPICVTNQVDASSTAPDVPYLVLGAVTLIAA